ncbi:predicted protein [Histoplasma capsulatum G186AR]|uniref:Uncharacterized protein n=1 Tax=Ajellomyces capsulatus (strain G186AR / H82 / ATCC MYA-2454 / RMSCC 2432) TaxID=447093 RepID=C0NRT2_AJECG|nr:uncharacterized protein HCBG_05862 [Histoplasma capsulatum G186AR]EEH05598.1 predicted protein [Histoplasma capsulatum G186AR]
MVKENERVHGPLECGACLLLGISKAIILGQGSPTSAKNRFAMQGRSSGHGPISYSGKLDHGLSGRRKGDNHALCGGHLCRPRAKRFSSCAVLSRRLGMNILTS